jgi:hypothetical protein
MHAAHEGHVQYTIDETLEIGLALTTALEHLHRNGLVHRDVKPSNVIFVNGQPKLADIGLVSSVDATRSFVGTEGLQSSGEAGEDRGRPQDPHAGCEPLKVKRMTRTGKPVQVTDNGEPLWILQPANGSEDEAERLRVTDNILDEVLRGRQSTISAVRVA